MKEKRLTQNFELSAELKKAIKEQATKEMLTPSVWIRITLAKALDEKNN